MISPIKSEFACRATPGGFSRSVRSLASATALILSILSPRLFAVDPPPDGGYTNFNTAEGLEALHYLPLPLDGFRNTGLGHYAAYYSEAVSSDTAVGNYALFENKTGSYNTAIGGTSLYNNTTGNDNTAIGHSALYDSTTASNNTAVGRWAVIRNTAGNNTGTGYGALDGNVTGSDNTADGAKAFFGDALFEDHTGSRNVARGYAALYSNAAGSDNTASGVNALYFNKAHYNTATGYQALEQNTDGFNNAAHGLNSLNANTTGSYNTANGAYALFSSLDGDSNTAVGELALYSNTSGYSNFAGGANSLYANTTGAFNIAVGFGAGFDLTTGGNNIDIGSLGVAGESGIIRMGAASAQTGTYIAGISGVTVTGAAVGVTGAGQLGVGASSARFKEKIRPMDKASEVVYSLKPVTFRYRPEVDPEGQAQFGLVAEQVAEVAPALVTRDEQGKPFTVRYEAVNAMLLNEFLKKHRQGQEQASRLENIQANLARFESLLNEQDAEIQIITAQLTTTKTDR